jgi:hypothetical protein
MAKPDNPEDYVPFDVGDDVVAYVSRDLLHRQKPGTRRIRFYIGGYGGYWLEFTEPWQGLGTQDRRQ